MLVVLWYRGELRFTSNRKYHETFLHRLQSQNFAGLSQTEQGQLKRRVIPENSEAIYRYLYTGGVQITPSADVEIDSKV